MSVTAKQALVIAKKYTDGSIEGITGSLAGKNCTIESQTYENGRNTIVFKWTADNGDVRRTTIVVRDGTPIYEWTSGDYYQYSDLVIYASCFYRCITPNSDEEFDATKWNEIGSPDGNYDIVETKTLLPAIFTAADRKVYFVIDESLFYLWDGEVWSAQKTKWNDITGKPEFADVATSGSYNDLDNKPDIPSKTSDLNNDSNFVSDANYVHTDNNYDATAKGIVDGVTMALEDKVDKVSGKGLSTNDYTDADKTIVSGVSTALDGKVDKITGKGLSTEDYTTAEQTKLSGIEAGAQVNVQSNWSQTNSEADDYIKNKPEIPDSQIQSDWNQSDNTLKDFIKNKPEIPAAQIQSDWNQSNNEAKDFIKNKPTLGTASSKDVAESGDASTTEVVMGNDTRLTDSRNAKDVYEWAKNPAKPTYTASEVGAVSSTQYATDMPKKVDKLTIMPTASSEYAGKIYQFDGTTDQNYTHGYFYECKEEDNVYSWVNVPVSAGGDVSGKADKVSNATNGNFAGLDSNGNLTDSGSKASDFLTQHQDITGKADKVTSATNGNFAGLDSNGNLTDSGSKASDFLGQVATLPTASSTLEGKVVQYIGASTNDYTHGYFYECEETSTDVYEWVNVSVNAGGGGGSGGHTIQDNAGTSMTQRTGLQFEGIAVSDDSTNDKTIVGIPQFTQAEWDDLSSADKAKYNGCQVIIKDDYGHDISTYATDEIEIGTFLGKTLYRKTIKLNQKLPKISETPRAYVYPISVPGGYVIKVDAVLYANNDYLTTASASQLCSIAWASAVNGVQLYRREDGTSADLYVKAIILEYTKEKWT